MLARLLIALTLTGCALGTEDDELLGDDVELDDIEQDATTQWYTQITREYFLPSAKVATEVKKVFKSEAEWVAFFGTASPGIDFTQSWAIFYTPGTQRADLANLAGWRAGLSRVTLSATGNTLSITTRLEKNGACPTRRGRPFVTATIQKGTLAPTSIRFYKTDALRDCD